MLLFRSDCCSGYIYDKDKATCVGGLLDTFYFLLHVYDLEMQYRNSIWYYQCIINAYNQNCLLFTKISNQEVINKTIFHISNF